MPTTLRKELTRAGFTPGSGGSTMIVQDYAPRALTRDHAKPSGNHTITSTDPILDRPFQNGNEWEGHRRMTAYDTTNVYLMVNTPYRGGRFIKIPLTAGAIAPTDNVTWVEDRYHEKRT